MKNKTSIVRSLILFIALMLIVGLFVMLLIKNPQVVSELTKKITVASAKMEFSSSYNNANAISEKISQQEAVATFSSDIGFDERLTISQSPLWRIELAPEENETPLEPDSPPQPTLSSSEAAGALPYPTSLETRSGTIREVTYGDYTSSQYIHLDNGGIVRNCTSVSNLVLDSESRLLPEFKIEINGPPQVLIMHTHTTESFEPYTRDYFDESFSSRTTDNKMNIVAVGDKIAQGLINSGINVIHDTTVHDYPSYNGSYQRSNETVAKILRENPSIKVVLDVHRDAIIPEDNVRIAPVAEIDGKKAAQIMIISGCDDGTMGMPNYMKNFRLASLFEQTIEQMYPTLTRPVLFDYRNYNQELTTGSLLIEVGSHANGIGDALYTGELLGKSLSEALLKLQ